jgi:hypothetical protein
MRARLTRRSCQRDNRRGEFRRCENARQARNQDRNRIDNDRARLDRDRAKLQRDRANGDWDRANRDRDRLQRDRGNLRNDKNDYNRDSRRECNNLSPRPKYVYVGSYGANWWDRANGLAAGATSTTKSAAADDFAYTLTRGI